MKLTLALLLLTTLAAPLRCQAPAPPQGSHGLRNQQYGLFLRPRDASNKDGEPIVLYPYQPWKCMAWRFDNHGEGTRLINFFTGKSFELQSSSGGNALVQTPLSPANLRAQSLHFIPLGQDTYEIEAPGAAGVLTAIDLDGKGVSPWKGTPAQKWQLVPLPDHFTM